MGAASRHPPSNKTVGMAQSQIQLLPALPRTLHHSCLGAGGGGHIPQELELGAEFQPCLGPAAQCRVALQVFGPGTEQPHWQNHWSWLRWLWLSPACDAEHGQGSCLGGWGPHSLLGARMGKQETIQAERRSFIPFLPCSFIPDLCPSPSLVHFIPTATAPFFFMYFWLCVGGAFIFLCIIHMVLFPHMDVGEDSWLQDGDKAGRSRISHQGCVYCQLHLKWDWILLCFGGAQIILWIKSCTPDSPLNALFSFKSASGWFKKFKRTSLGVYLPLKFCYWNICSIGL